MVAKKAEWLEDKPAVKVKSKEVKVVEREPQTVNLTPEQLQDILKTLITEMKKPSEEEQKKLDEEKALQRRLTEERIKIATEQEEIRTREQELCPHVKENGRPSIGGQIHNDGLIHPICVRCFKEFDPVKPLPHQLKGGVNLMA